MIKYLFSCPKFNNEEKTVDISEIKYDVIITNRSRPQTVLPPFLSRSLASVVSDISLSIFYKERPWTTWSFRRRSYLALKQFCSFSLKIIQPRTQIE